MDQKPTIDKAFLEEAKGILRITTDDKIINGEIEALIRSCQSDLIRNGITPKLAYDLKDSLITKAVFSYLKAEFGLDNKNYEKFRDSYEKLRTELALTEYYTNEQKVI